MKKMVLLLPMMAVWAVLLSGCSGDSSRSTARLRCVETIQPEALSDQPSLHFTGKVKETKQVNIAFKIGGAIEKVYARIGDHVQAGQLLAELDDSDYRIGLQTSEAQYAQMKSEVERLQVLYERKSISENDYEKALVGLKQMEAMLQGNTHKVNYCKLYAPTDGVIIEVNYHPAELVDAGMAVFSLLEDAELQVVFDLPAAMYSRQASFDCFYCRPSFAPEERFPMALAAITPKADNNQLYRVYLNFKGKSDARFTPGMNVLVDVCTRPQAEERGMMIVPLRTVCQREEIPFVWVINPDSTLRKQPVVLSGIDAEGNARISSGLDGTETLVRAGAATLQEGEKVRVL